MLIEVLVALGTAVVVLSATVMAVLAALNNAQFSKNQNIATQYAQQGMEVMRKMRNSNWRAFNALCIDSCSASYCLDKGVTSLDFYDGRDDSVAGCISARHVFDPEPDNPANIDGVYARQVDIETNSSSCVTTTPPPSGNLTKVTVSVSWSSNKCTRENLYCHKVELVSCLGRP